MKKLVLGAVLALLTSISMASIISVNLCDFNGTNASRNAMNSTDLAGAGVGTTSSVRVANWNNIKASTASNVTGSALVYDNGTTVGGAFKVAYTSPRAAAIATNYLSAMGNDARMYSGYDQVWNTQTVTTVLTDIPFAAYDLYIYCDAAWANGGGSIAVTGQQTYYVKTKNVILMTTNTGAGYVQITNTTQASAISGPQGSGNYVKYSGLSGTSQTIALSALDMGNATTHRLQFNGFQIVQAAETPAVAGFTASPVTGAVPLAVTFTDTSTGSITNRYWDFGDGATSNTTAKSVAHTYASSGTYTVSLTVSGALGDSTNTQNNVITVSGPVAPTAGFSATPTSGMYPLLVNFTDTSFGSITNRFWNFGDGATSNTTATSVSHTYTSAGTNTVELIVSGPAGSATNTQSNLIMVSGPVPPTAGFSASPTSGVESLMVNFTDTSIGTITNRFWDFGDGTTTNITATTVSHTYTVGTRTVHLTASGPAGSDTKTQVDLIRVEPLPANVIRVAASKDDQQLTSIGGLANNPTASAGSGSPITTTNTYVIPFQLPTIPVGQTITNVQFSAFLISTYSFGATNIQVYVDVFGGRVDASSAVLTNDWSVSTAIGDNIAQISKDYTAINMVKSVALTASFFQDIYANDANAAGKYVFLTLRPDAASPNASAVTTWATANHTTLPTPTLDFSTSAGGIVAGFSALPTSGTAPLEVTFTDTSTGSITDRYWDFGDGATSNTTATSVAHTYAAGTYTVSLIVSGADGASTNTQSNVITVSAPVAVPPPAPVVSIGISGNQNIISWTTVQGSGYVYSVYYSTNLLNGFLPLQADLADTVNSLTNAIIAPAAFYQIKAR